MTGKLMNNCSSSRTNYYHIIYGSHLFFGIEFPVNIKKKSISFPNTGVYFV